MLHYLSLTVLVQVAASAVALFPTAPPVPADDKKAPTQPTVECRPFPKAPDGVKFLYTIVVTLDGSDTLLMSEDNRADGVLSGEALAEFLAAVLKQTEGVKCSVVGTKLVIEGWKNPKTGAFHKVKEIRFTSPNLPPENFPTITLPKQ